VTELLARRSLPSDLLTLEVPESAFRTGTPAVLETLATLGDRGIRISVDDCAADPAAMEHLRATRIHELKIAPEAVGRIRGDDSDESAVRAVLDLAADLRVPVVAESVEDEQTWRRLRALGCEAGQGHWLGTPLPGADLTDWLIRRPIPTSTRS
jgi:EAL domain-containing protein (putative c-di-GMP-specific phosphodiesterase class I)